MAKNLWELERKQIYRELLKEYEEEGYDKKEAKRLARLETEEYMVDKMSIVGTYFEGEEDET